MKESINKHAIVFLTFADNAMAITDVLKTMLSDKGESPLNKIYLLLQVVRS